MEDRICILALDALEYELVEKFDMDILKQKEYGKTDISGFSKIATPILWGSFVTGKNMGDRFTDKEEKNFLRNLIRPPFQFIKSKWPNLTHDVKKFGDWLGLTHQVRGKIFHLDVRGDMGMKTIFEEVENSIAINVPACGKDRKPDYGMNDYLDGVIDDEVYWNDSWSCYDETRGKLLDNLDMDLVMAWFCPADRIGHIFRSDMDKMKETYERLCDLVVEVKDNFEGTVLIVSDHGMRRIGDFGDHSDMDYGFYSVNRKVGLNNPKLTDFYDFVLEGRVSSRERKTRNRDIDRKHEEDREEVKRRLKELGYFD